MFPNGRRIAAAVVCSAAFRSVEWSDAASLSRRIGPDMTGRFGATSSRPQMSLMGRPPLVDLTISTAESCHRILAPELPPPPSSMANNDPLGAQSARRRRSLCGALSARAVHESEAAQGAEQCVAGARAKWPDILALRPLVVR